MRSSPAFWWTPTPTGLARLLGPAAALYGTIAGRRLSQRGQLVGAPVICVGNFVVGGAGKTPTVLALVEGLRARGRHPVIVSRGYGSRAARNPTPVRVDPDRHDAAAVGDEPLLLARTAPTYVGADRVASARAGLAAGGDIVLLDDGLQNPALHKDFGLAVVDGAVGFGNGLVLPAGPLRAPLAAQWRLAHALLVIGPGAAGDRAAAAVQAQGIPVVRARLVPGPATAASLRDKPVVAFAGIGRPDKFRTTLTEMAVDLVGWHPFADHQPVSQAGLAALQHEARRKGATLVTTEKDLARLPAAWRSGVVAVPITLEWAAQTPLSALLGSMLKA